MSQSHTKVLEIELREDGSFSLIVAVFGFETDTLVEISGHATQANGAIATFYDVQNLPPAGPDGSSLLRVTAVPSTEFVAGDVITVAGQARAVKLWGTVLDPDRDKRPGIKAAWKADPET
jgi:hypothetical protein